MQISMLYTVILYCPVIVVGVSYFSDRFTFSNIRGGTSRRIYRLALPLISSETLSSLCKLRIFLFNAHLALFVQRMTQLWSLNSIGKYRHLVNRPWNLP